MNKILKISCPSCEIEFSYYESAFRPFCSERCKQIDLGHWFSESYRVPEKASAKDESMDAESNLEMNMDNYSDEYE